jgi:hypothetical protein
MTDMGLAFIGSMALVIVGLIIYVIHKAEKEQ